MVKIVKRHQLLVFMIIASIVKIVMVSNLPVLILTASGHDDGLMVNTAISLGRMEWLGDYSHMTLVKGMFFPFFLGVSKLFSIPYLTSSALYYILGCFVFVYGVKDIFRNKIYSAILFTALLFNPISYSLDAFQRIYRSSMSPAQVLIITGCFFAVYLKREQTIKKLLPWLILGGIALASMWFTREDAVWILPFVIGCVVVTAGSFISRFFGTGEKKYIAKAGICSIPLIMLILSTLIISTINYSYYGIFTKNELNDSNFTHAIKSIYSVKPVEEIDFVSVPRSTVKRLYEASPTLNSISIDLENLLDAWEACGKVVGDGEVEDGWFFWSLRDAVFSAGYYSDAHTANEFYLNVHNEIEQALDEGLLERRSTMPSALMSPWRDGYSKKLIFAMGDTMEFVASYKDVNPFLAQSSGQDAQRFDLFEYITGNYGYNANIEMNDLPVNFWTKLVNKNNLIAETYKKTGIPFCYAGIIGYLWITVMIIRKVRKNEREFADTWLMLTSILLSLTVLFLGVSYTHISAYDAINPIYLSAAYPLLTSFIFIAVLFSLQHLITLIKEKGKSNESK